MSHNNGPTSKLAAKIAITKECPKCGCPGDILILDAYIKSNVIFCD
jgi:hypothetical protein